MESFSASLALCAGSSPVTGEFPSQGPATQSFDVLFGLRVNKRLNKQSWSWWLVTPLRSLRRHCNELWTALPAYAPRWCLIASSCVHPCSTCPLYLCINSEKLRIPRIIWIQPMYYPYYSLNEFFYCVTRVMLFCSYCSTCSILVSYKDLTMKLKAIKPSNGLEHLSPLSPNFLLQDYG